MKTTETELKIINLHFISKGFSLLNYRRVRQHGLRETSHPLGVCDGAPLRHSDWLSQIDFNRHHHSAVSPSAANIALQSPIFIFFVFFLGFNDRLLSFK